MIKTRVEQLRNLMRERDIDAYLIPTADFHESEYVGTYFKCREYLTGFTGSQGTAVITLDRGILWTDGRYFIQAEAELADTGIELFRMGQVGVPEIEDFLYDDIKANGRLGFDGRVINTAMGNKLKSRLGKKGITIKCDEDLAGLVWEQRPGLSREPVFILEELYAGKSAALKIADLRRDMKEKEADIHILTSLPDLNWLLNIRGNDIFCCPVVLCYGIITLDEFYLFIQEETLNDQLRAYLNGLGVTILPYDDIYGFVRELKGFKTVLLDLSMVNYRIYKNLPGDILILDEQNSTLVPKAVKNPVEVENIRQAHIKDGVAVTKLMYWLKQNVGKIPLCELSVAARVEELRREQEGFIGPSFKTISAYRENAAMCHYSATEQSNRKVHPEGMLLVDSGGHYYQGSTDITRTFILGAVTAEMKMHFTLVAASMLRLGAAKFLYGCRGINLDYIARGPFWERGLDFNHGTGHGVGYLLGIHEPPNGFRWRIVPERMDSGILEEGMITSDEPGLYFEGSHGIRTENLLVCKKGERNEYGQFMEFEHLTYVPIDLDGIDVSHLDDRDRELLNAYHEAVYEKISPWLTAEERQWLSTYTRSV